MQTQSFDSQFDNTFDATINSRISNRSDSQAQANTQSSFEFQTPHNRMQRWVCHVSSKTKLKATHKQVMNVKPNTKMSPFDIIERLLFSKTCDVIYSDETLPLHQVKMLKQMAMFSGTDIEFISDRSYFNMSQSIA